jgi:hypothetical protein
MDNKSIVLVGKIFDGYTSYGPFADFEAAVNWAENKRFSHEWLVATLHHPNNLEEN